MKEVLKRMEQRENELEDRNPTMADQCGCKRANNCTNISCQLVAKSQEKGKGPD